MIPFLIGAAAVGAGLVGGKKMYEAKQLWNAAEEWNEEAEDLVSSAESSRNQKRRACEAEIERLGRAKIAILSGTMADFVDVYKNLKNVRLKGSIGKESLRNFVPESPHFQDVESATLQAVEISGSLAKGLGSGAVLAYGAYSATASLAVAGTGTAISALSGAAASNATLAWLGGGTLASGGFGIAGGTAALGGIVAVPVLVMLGSFAKSKAKEALYNAKSNYAKAEAFSESCKNEISLMDAIETRAGQIIDLAQRLDTLLGQEVGKMSSSLREAGTMDFKKLPKNVREQIGITVQLAVLVKRVVIDTPLLTEEGLLSPQSEQVVLQEQQMLSEVGNASLGTKMVNSIKRLWIR